MTPAQEKYRSKRPGKPVISELNKEIRRVMRAVESGKSVEYIHHKFSEAAINGASALNQY